jgi:hypothetical protein
MSPESFSQWRRRIEAEYGARNIEIRYMEQSGKIVAAQAIHYREVVSEWPESDTPNLGRIAYNMALEIRYAVAASGVDPIQHIPEVDVIIERRLAECRREALEEAAKEIERIAPTIEVPERHVPVTDDFGETIGHFIARAGLRKRYTTGDRAAAAIRALAKAKEGDDK